jgi:hypothetical protein
MKKLFLSLLMWAFIFTCDFLSPLNADAGHDFGLGIQVGNMGGITGIVNPDDRAMIQGVIGTFWYDGLLLGADYCVKFPGAFSGNNVLTPYIGGGGYAFSGTSWRRTDRYSGFGVQMPFGIIVDLPKVPVHIYAQIAPAINRVPFTDSYLQFAVGARFLF